MFVIFMIEVNYQLDAQVLLLHDENVELIEENAKLRDKVDSYKNVVEVSSVRKESILISNFYDYITASGFTQNDVYVENGYFKYDGYFIVATPIESRYDGGLYEGYNNYELYDIINIKLNDEWVEAIVLDVCGACYGLPHESRQRYDIWTTHDFIGLQESEVEL